jgi:hypothetical protein
VAKEWRDVWALMVFARPARRTTTLMALLDGLVDDAGGDVMAAGDTGTRVHGEIPGGQGVLLALLPRAFGYFRAGAWVGRPRHAPATESADATP